MKILHYVDENKLAWAVPWLQLIRYLEDSGTSNHILCRPGGSLQQHAAAKNIAFSTYKPPLPALPFLCPGIASIIGNIAPDLIHTRLSSAAMIGGYWGRRSGVPVISTIDKYPKRRYYLNSDVLVPCSAAVAAHMQSIGFPEASMHLVYNPVSMEEYRRNPEQRQDFRRQHAMYEESFVILGAGRFVDWKAFEILIKACSRLKSSGGIDRKWELWLVGDGPEKPTYEKCVAENNMVDKTTFWGFQDDVKKFLWAADLFVQPSRQPEGFSLMLLEAMAAGLPCIATAIGGTLDIIDDNMNGWLFEPDDVQKLAAILQDLLLADSLDQYADRAFGRAGEFSIERIGNQTLRLYEDVIRKNLDNTGNNRQVMTW